MYNDAGLLDFGRRQYILAFMSVAERESIALAALREAVWQIGLLEQAQKPVLRPPRVQG